MDKFFASNPGFRARFASHIDFPDYSDNELLAIAELLLRDMNYSLALKAGRRSSVVRSPCGRPSHCFLTPARSATRSTACGCQANRLRRPRPSANRRRHHVAGGVRCAGQQGVFELAQRLITPGEILIGINKLALRRAMKFMHTIGVLGQMGAMASLLVLLSFIPAPTSPSEYSLMRGAMGGIATWIFSPVAWARFDYRPTGNRPQQRYQSAGWAWAKFFSASRYWSGVRGNSGANTTGSITERPCLWPTRSIQLPSRHRWAPNRNRSGCCLRSRQRM
jgi:hypothetical protein